MLRRKSSSPGNGSGGSGKVTFLYAAQNCCSASLQGDSEQANSGDLQLACACMAQASAGEMEAVARFFKHELAAANRPKPVLLLVLNVLNALVGFGVREFSLAVIKGANALLGELEALTHVSDGDVANRAAEILQVWNAQFRADRQLAFRIEVRSSEEEDMFMQTELARFDTLLSSLEDELSKTSNSKQLEQNALVSELVRACDRIGPELRSMIELSSQDLLTRLLEMNDRLLRAIALHRDIASRAPETYNPFDDPQVLAQVFRPRQ